MKKHISIRISGVVQGVFFRASAKEKADSLNINGFIRNSSDGSVYAEAEGEEENLAKFLEWCKRGPSHARVDQCEVREGDLMHYHRFNIER